MSLQNRALRAAQTFGITLVAGGLVLASTVSAQAAAQKWELVGGKEILIAYNVDAGHVRRDCVRAGSWHTLDSSVKTVAYNAGDGCIDGAGKECKTFVPTNPKMGWWRFDATTCTWTNMVSQPI